jgi:branched-chain amino acid transport system substrate-binding protein
MVRVGRVLALVVCLLHGAASGGDGGSNHELRIGMANALSGPAAGLGLQLRAGAAAYLDKVNAAGGVHGRTIRLISVDDAYDPQQSAAATTALIEKEQVLALFGYVGTPTSTAAVPIASKAGVPYLFPFTGAEFLRNPVNPVVFNVRASYFDETEALVARVTGEMGLHRIGIVIQDDEFGEAGKAGVLRALHKRDMALLFEGRYRRNTVQIEASMASISRAAPDAVIFIGTYRPLAALVKATRASGIKTHFMTVSFVGTSEFIKHAGPVAENVIISQVMPSPEDPSDPLVRQYHSDVVPAARNYGSLEGYADAMILVEALKHCGPNPSRESLLVTLEQFKTEIGRVPLAYSKASHQGSNRVYLTQVKDGRAVPIGKN